MYSTAAIYLLWLQDSFCEGCRFWLHCHIYNISWTLGIRCNLFCSTSLFVSKPLSVFIVSTGRLSPVNKLLLVRANCLTTTFSRRVSPVVVDCLHLIMFRPTEKQATALTACGMIVNMARAIFQTMMYFVCISSCGWNQAMRSVFKNVLLMSIGSEW